MVVESALMYTVDKLRALLSIAVIFQNDREMNILLLATAWGPKYGGINSFNQDFALGLGTNLLGKGRVFCAVPHATEDERRHAEKGHVTLVSINKPPDVDRFDASWSFDLSARLRRESSVERIDYWVGHDVLTGEAAIQGAQLSESLSALIMHMSYISYQSIKHDAAADEAARKHNIQKKIFRTGSRLFAVGPLLREVCAQMTSREVVQLVPGFPETETQHSPSDKVVAVTFGRLDSASDRIKQGRLAAAAFGSAIHEAMRPGGQRALHGARLAVIGIREDSGTEAKEIKDLTDRHAGRIANVLPLPFDERRSELLSTLSESNLAMMLSLQEGFGLAGWEAIASEIPLILSVSSGLHKLIADTLGGAGLGCVRGIDIQGHRGDAQEMNFTERDLQVVRDEILEIASRLSFHKENARNLKKLLDEKLNCTWQNAAQLFVESLTVSTASPSVAPIHVQAPTSTQATRTQDTKTTKFESATNNSIPECAELNLSTTQGSSRTQFDVLAELRFGRVELLVDDSVVAFGLEEAFLQLSLTGAQIPIGSPRLGDDDSNASVASVPSNRWIIKGPAENGCLMRKALGDQALCQLSGNSEGEIGVSAGRYCRERHVKYEVVDGAGRDASINKQRVIGAFLNKCLGVTDGILQLSSATLMHKENPS